MAFSAVRHNTMLVGMTEDTLELSMFGRTGLKGCSDIRVTSGTVRVGDSLRIDKGEGLMCLMAGNTVCKFLSFDMWIVTIQAVGTITVFCMTK